MSNKYINLTNKKILKKLLGFPVIGILVHWTFQSLLYMDKTEKFIKLLLDAILTICFSVLIFRHVGFPHNLIIAFLLAHTLNFLFNSHFWTLLKHYGLAIHTKEYFYKYIEGFSFRLGKTHCAQYAAIFGSWARNEWTPLSDLDIRIVRKPGLLIGIQACIFTIAERIRAFMCRFPLDIYLLDGLTRLSALRQDEIPVVLFDSRSDFQQNQ